MDVTFCRCVEETLAIRSFRLFHHDVDETRRISANCVQTRGVCDTIQSELDAGIVPLRPAKPTVALLPVRLNGYGLSTTVGVGVLCKLVHIEPWLL